MVDENEAADAAAALVGAISVLVRRLRQVAGDGELTLSERSALSRLDRSGPSTPGELARLEQISPQSMGTMLGALEVRGLVGRQADPHDGRRAVMTLTDEGVETLRSRRTMRAERVARALATGFTRSEVRQLMAAAPLLERLAERV